MDWRSFFLSMLFYFCQRLGKEILVEDWKVTINRGLGSVSCWTQLMPTNDEQRLLKKTDSILQECWNATSEKECTFSQNILHPLHRYICWKRLLLSIRFTSSKSCYFLGYVYIYHFMWNNIAFVWIVDLIKENLAKCYFLCGWLCFLKWVCIQFVDSNHAPMKWSVCFK